MADELSVIGKPENLDQQGHLVVTGKLDFAADRIPPGKLYARVLGAPHAHALITSIDTSRAEALPGVEAVLTYEEHPLWSDGIFYHGQEVAAVAAVDPNTAARAIRLIDVEYDVRPNITDPDEAMQPGAILSGLLPDTNVTPLPPTVRGDIETGFSNAEVTLETEQPWTAAYQHGTLETCSCVAYWVNEDLYIWTGSQTPFGLRANISNWLGGHPLHRIHLVSHGTGAGFGDKPSGQWLPTAVLLARKTGKPVEFTLTRRENYINRQRQFPCKSSIRFGAKNDGTLTAIDAAFWCDTQSSAGGWTAGGVPQGLQRTYVCPDARFSVTSVVNNKPNIGPWRCVSDPPGSGAYEAALDKIAEQLGMNPYQFRMKNMVTADMVDQDNGMVLSSNGVRECFEKCADSIGFNDKWHAPGTKTLSDGRLHGIGIAGHVDGHGGPFGMNGAIVSITADGKAELNVGISRAGGGTNTAMCHIVAERLGMKYEDVRTGQWGETDASADGGMQAGSSRTVTISGAFYNAAGDCREQLFQVATRALGVPPHEMDARDSIVFEKANPENAVPYRAVVGGYGFAMPVVIGRGTAWGAQLRRPHLGFDVGTPCRVGGTCASAAEVAVDPETGEIEILAHVNAVDNGRTIFYQGAMKQLIGGSEIQIGQALFYGQVTDEATGAALNPNYLEAKFPTTLDINPQKLQGFLIETDDAVGAYGCKGMGEPVVPNYPCISNALYNAIGKWVPFPITPPKILEAMGKA